MTEDYVQTKIRLGTSNHSWLKARAAKNRRSITSEVNVLIEKMRKEKNSNHQI
ncbi:hypothetical protein K6Q96_09000 [Grimontia kaedaensis]|uniref:Arc-like DNA binding domain-containing protein n=1 Tax=Grimontia kaedaensis TaxID=2872157 RepID=A0ABY4WRD8_9GAMM|nr:hypothetical protein [Grimontia kaedaensis]USH01078.1 hypothetical protein K6Q96_09000 [Grimontia kaedaensis]